ncbi:hypothetical protein ACH5RR_040975 [Cinchona calisaya]|uniref:Uncharacterized protein n=1 Tax=Cinchona calisaya TaxID=153742 RepID=A0ABD2XXN3_9GENT
MGSAIALEEKRELRMRMNWSLENGIDARELAKEWGGVGKCGFSSSSYISCNPASDSSSCSSSSDLTLYARRPLPRYCPDRVVRCILCGCGTGSG